MHKRSSSSTPPRIPVAVRLEAVAAAEAATAAAAARRRPRGDDHHRNTSPRLSGRPVRPAWRRSASSYDGSNARNTTHPSSTLRRSHSSVEPRARSSLGSPERHAAAAPLPHQAGASPPPALERLVMPVAESRRSSCPPITRRVRPAHSAEDTQLLSLVGKQRRTSTAVIRRTHSEGDPLRDAAASAAAQTRPRSCREPFIPAPSPKANPGDRPLIKEPEATRFTTTLVETRGVGDWGEGGNALVKVADSRKYMREGTESHRNPEVSCSNGGQHQQPAALDPSERLATDAKLRFERLRKISENRRCADCGGPCADWASICHGAFVCLNCAGHHRALGLHVAFTRSLTMDRWTEESVRRMEMGGNERLLEFVQRAGCYMGHPWTSMGEKYRHPCLRLYREYIAAVGDGEEPPSLSREALDEAVVDGGTGSGDVEGGESASPLRKLARTLSNCSDLGSAFLKCSWARGFAQARSVPIKGMGGTGGAPKWVPDNEATGCMLCGSRFTVVLRRHHCRRCGRVACAACAPTNNTRPIIEWSMPQAVRHCHLCYRSPLLEWTNMRSTAGDE